jgi:hypothetical protein
VTGLARNDQDSVRSKNFSGLRPCPPGYGDPVECLSVEVFWGRENFYVPTPHFQVEGFTPKSSVPVCRLCCDLDLQLEWVKTRYACRNLAGILVDLEDETTMEIAKDKSDCVCEWD